MILALVALAVSGCATLFGERSDPIRLDSEPEGAEVYYRGEKIGTTPLSMDFARRSEAAFIVLKKSGYQDKRVELQRRVTPVAFWNFGYFITTSGVSSWGTDVSSGRMWEYAPRKYAVQLEAHEAGNWNERVFEFVLASSERLKSGFSRRTSEDVEALCHLLAYDDSKCRSLSEEVAGSPGLLVANPFEFYVGLHGIGMAFDREDQTSVRF